MTVSLCIRQGSKRNDDSVSVEELDWSAERQLNTSGVTLNEPKTHHQTLMTCTFIIWTKVVLALEEKKTLPNCGNKDGNIIHVLKLYFRLCCNSFEVFVAHLKSHQKCSAAFCRPVKFFHTDWIIISLWSLSYTQRHCHVRIEKGPVQTVAIKLEGHNSLEYHYMLKH